jgi:hypothetical protein
VFANCTSLTSVTIPNGVTSIGDYGFYDCRSLTNATIPGSVTSIGDHAFADSGLADITIPDSVTRIGDWAFGFNSNLTAITVDALNPAYSSVNGVLFNHTRTTLIQYPAGNAATTCLISSSVTNIGAMRSIVAFTSPASRSPTTWPALVTMRSTAART